MFGSALLECCFQLAIVATGNYAWINWIGIVPYLALLDDDILKRVFPRAIVEAASEADAASEHRISDDVETACNKISSQAFFSLACNAVFRMRRLVSMLISVLLVLNIAVRSADPIKELFAHSPWLHIYDDCKSSSL